MVSALITARLAMNSKRMRPLFCIGKGSPSAPTRVEEKASLPDSYRTETRDHFPAAAPMLGTIGMPSARTVMPDLAVLSPTSIVMRYFPFGMST